VRNPRFTFLGDDMMTAVDAVEDSGAVGSPGKRVGRRGRLKTALPVKGVALPEKREEEEVVERPCSEEMVGDGGGGWLGGGVARGWEMGGRFTKG
jgi:hypothetical protein